MMHGQRLAFAVGTESGFRRRKPETLPELLRLHLAVAELP